MDGLLIINKERGFTSFDVIAKLRSMLGQKKIGHLGTLDPEAEGVLPIVLGKATRLADLMSRGNKVYCTTLRLGITTDTQDTSGRLLKMNPVPDDIGRIEQTILSFTGEQDQLPPMVSAKKVDGQKLVDLARKGIEIERKPVRITIYHIEILAISLPLVRMRVHCSKGTYIRTLCHDIGTRLGCGAAMESLVREESAGWKLEDSVYLDEVEALSLSGHLSEKLISIETMLSAFPSFICKPEADKMAENGNKLLLPPDVSTPPLSENDFIKVYTSRQKLLGLYQVEKDGCRIKPAVMLNSKEEEVRPQKQGSVVSLGKFDGLHIGHQEIIRTMLKQAEAEKLRPILFSFTTPPEALTKGHAEKLLFTPAEKRRIALDLGVRGIREVRFTEDIRNMKAIDFLKNVLIEKLGMRQIVVGPDCCFGYGREGNVDFLKAHAKEFGYQLTIVEKVRLNGGIVSSTRIRKLLSEGNITEAAACLGRPFFYSGRVAYGNQLGRRLGFPTVNLPVSAVKYLPPFGVYVSRTCTGNTVYEGISNLGVKPSVADKNQLPGMESYLFGTAECLYGQEIKTELLAFLRQEKRFSSPEELREQLKRDEASAKAFFRTDN